MKKRHWLLPVLIISLFLLLAGCGNQGSDPTPPATPPESPVVTESPDPVETPEPSPEPSPEPDQAIFSSVPDLAKYLFSEMNQGNYQMSFEYTGNSNRIKSETLSELLSVLYVDVERDPENRKMYHITVHGYPGEDIVAAWESGDTSSLSEEELSVLYEAQGLADLALAQVAADPDAAENEAVALETAIHDLLCELITPYTVKTVLSNPAEPPRAMTVFGALLDQTANSYGYSDAFYVVATMAGLEVDRMCVIKTYTDVAMVNTICLDGNWYVVDLFHNDSKELELRYGIFNNGRSTCTEYSWSSEMERHPVYPFDYGSEYDETAEIVKIKDLIGLRDYLNEQMDLGYNNFVFEYLGNASDISLSNLNCIVYDNTISIYQDPENTSIYYIGMLKRAGYRIVEAYFSGDTSNLSPEDIEAMNLAIEIVNNAKAIATNELELEMLLHDELVNRMVYDNITGKDDMYGTNRIYSVVGGLLDGAGNCQSYTDAFYTLASIAGFQVGKQVVAVGDNPDHIVNTICLGGQWYIVDVTFDDPVGFESGSISRNLFNIGKDMAFSYYTWEEFYEYQPIAETTGEYYYYYAPELGGNRAFATLDEAIDFILDEWKRGEMSVPAVALNQTVDGSTFMDRVYDEVVAQNLECSWQAYVDSNGKDSIFYVEFLIEYKP